MAPSAGVLLSRRVPRQQDQHPAHDSLAVTPLDSQETPSPPHPSTPSLCSHWFQTGSLQEDFSRAACKFHTPCPGSDFVPLWQHSPGLRRNGANSIIRKCTASAIVAVSAFFTRGQSWGVPPGCRVCGVVGGEGSERRWQGCHWGWSGWCLCIGTKS